jgi:DNA-binding NarL/FixJ family response regulator
VALVGSHRANIVLVPRFVSALGTAQFVGALSRANPGSDLILIGDEPVDQSGTELANHSIRGYWTWEGLTHDSVVAAIDSVLAYGFWIGTPHVFWSAPSASDPHSSPSTQFTENEAAVLRGLDSELTEVAIGEKEHISRRTVQRALTSLETKLGCQSRYGLGKRVGELSLGQENLSFAGRGRR